MFYQILEVHFSNLFGKCPVIAINEFDDLIQIKYNLAEIDPKMIYTGLKRLKGIYGKAGYGVRVLFVYPGILQVIIGTKQEVSKIGNEDFKLEIC